MNAGFPVNPKIFRKPGINDFHYVTATNANFVNVFFAVFVFGERHFVIILTLWSPQTYWAPRGHFSTPKSAGLQMRILIWAEWSTYWHQKIYYLSRFLVKLQYSDSVIKWFYTFGTFIFLLTSFRGLESSSFENRLFKKARELKIYRKTRHSVNFPPPNFQLFGTIIFGFCDQNNAKKVRK